MPRLLVVEDETKLLRSLQHGLEAEGHVVTPAASGLEASALLAGNTFDCVVLDWMLPGKDGLPVLRDLRVTGNRVPVLMLTARDTVADRVLGLESGADDYLVKPFAFAELVARIQALLRRGKADRETVLRAGDLVIDLLDRRVTLGGEEVELRPREYEVLVYLLRHRGATVTREMLGRDVWREPGYHLTNVIDVTMTLLRKKLDRPDQPPPVQTVRGVGFAVRT